MKVLSNKTAVVIGGGGGVGRGVCLGLAGKGMNVVVADIDLNAAMHVTDEISRNGNSSVAAQVDATNNESLVQLAEEAVRRFQNVNVLVNTVGVILERRLEDITEKEWYWIWNLNVIAQLKAVKVFLPTLRKSNDAHIVLTASGAGFTASSPELRIGAYSTTKHALVGYAKTLRNRESIGVSLLCPSGVVGNLAETSAKSYNKHIGQQDRDFGGRQPARRKLVDNAVMGAITAEVIKNNSFIGSNNKEALLDAIKDEYESLLTQ
ncbi:MAG TPA: SDR family oxidoreductase [Candidatus Saccharimonadales bacterium]|nr:SDR family oxidoreductase [Candidatus Saccharimonadales bacterium]